MDSRQADTEGTSKRAAFRGVLTVLAIGAAFSGVPLWQAALSVAAVYVLTAWIL